MTPTRALRSVLLLAVLLQPIACSPTAESPSGVAEPATGDVDATAAHGDFPEEISLPDGFRPEGVTSGPGSTFYVGSLADGRVYRGDLQTGEGARLVPGVKGRVAVGMQWESRRGGRLWVAGGPTGAVTVYDASTGAEIERWTVPGSGFLNDVAVTDEAVYVTDSMVQRLVVIPLGRGGAVPDEGAATTRRLSGDIAYTDGFNANGIRAVDDGRALVLVQSSTGKLFRVDPGTGVAETIDVMGDDLLSGDGLELDGERLYVVRGGGGNDVAVLRLEPDAGGARFERLLTDDDLDVPTTATVAADRLWVVNGRFDTTPTPTTPYSVVQVETEE